MTTAQLITKLQQFPPNTDVVYFDGEYLVDVKQVQSNTLHFDKYGNSYTNEELSGYVPPNKLIHERPVVVLE